MQSPCAAQLAGADWSCFRLGDSLPLYFPEQLGVCSTLHDRGAARAAALSFPQWWTPDERVWGRGAVPSLGLIKPLPKLPVSPQSGAPNWCLRFRALCGARTSVIWIVASFEKLRHTKEGEEPKCDLAQTPAGPVGRERGGEPCVERMGWGWRVARVGLHFVLL